MPSLSNVIVAGDFNVDMRGLGKKNLVTRNKFAAFPCVVEMVDNSSPAFPSFEYGSTNKMRSMYQAQNSKMELPDCFLKDYILVGKDFEIDGGYKGLVHIQEYLPTSQFPSDHALIYASIIVRSKRRRTEFERKEAQKGVARKTN